jgi:hypothetical protein
MSTDSTSGTLPLLRCDPYLAVGGIDVVQRSGLLRALRADLSIEESSNFFPPLIALANHVLPAPSPNIACTWT